MRTRPFINLSVAHRMLGKVDKLLRGILPQLLRSLIKLVRDDGSVGLRVSVNPNAFAAAFVASSRQTMVMPASNRPRSSVSNNAANSLMVEGLVNVRQSIAPPISKVLSSVSFAPSAQVRYVLTESTRAPASSSCCSNCSREMLALGTKKFRRVSDSRLSQ